MGKDKFEKRFHVDNLSSAHVYLRMPDGMKWDSIPDALLTDCAQLVKANSIEGNKKDNINVVYTPWSNLKKTKGMEVGQVGFHKEGLRKKIFVEKRSNEIVNRLNKTKIEREVDFSQEKINRDRTKRKERQERERKQRQEAVQKQREKEERERQLHYEDVFENAVMKSNYDNQNLEDDFM
ncbi:hypothetical protein O9G_002438 [Rozella allomycis CSF55]|uniref:NFACT RNA-binding domain-containing protein n=1 Tax=Rozella allomycis (strain CSF55) TaxID=988480 RepID=A0A075AWX9_ROZAC|nr:hypothetical protein O9G_002438 [Rozella allomycis CSF55]|eukprot:EPZ34840.1 hypothetical protein O9G_002438 [Rozella allomycis CSF55]